MDEELSFATRVIYFIFGCIFFGLLLGVACLKLMSSDIRLGLMIWIASTLLFSFLVAWKGDDAWKFLIQLLRTWL